MGFKVGDNVTVEGMGTRVFKVSDIDSDYMTLDYASDGDSDLLLSIDVPTDFGVYLNIKKEESTCDCKDPSCDCTVPEEFLKCYTNDSQAKHTNYTVTKDDFIKMSTQTLNEVLSLFIKKNNSYAGADNVMYSFEEGAMRQYGEVTPQLMLDKILQFKDKHDVALLHKGLECGEYEDRLKDIIVYCLFAIAVGKLE